jgi:hypothetical protein
LFPAQVDNFRGSEAVTIGQKDHEGIAATMPVGPGGFDQALDLAIGEVLARAQIAILGPSRDNRSIFSARRHQAKVRFRCHFRLHLMRTVQRMIVL